MKRIETIHVFAYDHPTDNQERILSHKVGGNWVPMVFTDLEDMTETRAAAAVVQEKSGFQVRIKKYVLVSEEFA